MTKKTTATKTAETPNKKPCRCRDCEHAHLVQYGLNPVIAECTKKPNEGNPRFPYTVDVASTLKHCSVYHLRTTAEKIEHRPVRYTLFLTRTA